MASVTVADTILVSNEDDILKCALHLFVLMPTPSFSCTKCSQYRTPSLALHSEICTPFRDTLLLQVIAHTDRGWVSCYARLRSILSSLFCTLPRGLRRTRNRSKIDSRSENEAPETLLGLQMNRSASEFDMAPQKLDLASSTSPISLTS
ncbi:autophagy-related protein 3 [Iris pallida]|uniref:Autophagy-related protein 3 n=1 Tax=Iris pallida TaxID=29817 RepID=A0AAX6GW32_IRIPA|nr:autophagy-related protein 3 [Iris pallida]